MDRVIVFAGQIPLETDVLKAGQYGMVGLAKLTESVLGTPICTSGFACAPTAPATLAVTLGPGTVYQQENLEQTALSSLPADTTHTIVKQGILLDATNITFTPPGTVGYSQCFLIEVAYQDVDTGALVKSYYNAANPLVQFNGPGGAGTADNTVRKGAVAYQIKAGVAATSGTQTIPSPDAGYAGLWVITLAQGATSVTAGNITAYAGSPTIPVTLPLVPSGAQSGKWWTSTDTGAVNAYVAGATTSLATPTVGTIVEIAGIQNANTGASTLSFGGTTYAIVRNDGSVLQRGDLPVNFWPLFRFDGTRFLLLNIPFQSVRTNLVNNLTVYVRTDGNDANSGLTNTSGGAFATIQGAWNKLCALFNFAGYTVTIQLGIAGTYAGAVFTNLGSSGNIVLSGNTGSASSYIVTPITNIVTSCLRSQVGTITTTGITFDFSTASSGFAVWSNSGGNIVVGNATTIKYTSSNTSVGLLCVDGAGAMSTAGTITFLGTGTVGNVVTINAGGSYTGGSIGSTITVTNLTYTNFCFTSAGNSYWQNTSFSSSGVTGARYSAVLNGTINTLGGGANFFPGTSAGSTSTGGEYA